VKTCRTSCCPRRSRSRAAAGETEKHKQKARACASHRGAGAVGALPRFEYHLISTESEASRALPESARSAFDLKMMNVKIPKKRNFRWRRRQYDNDAEWRVRAGRHAHRPDRRRRDISRRACPREKENMGPVRGPVAERGPITRVSDDFSARLCFFSPVLARASSHLCRACLL